MATPQTAKSRPIYKKRRILDKHLKGVSSVAFSPDGRYIASSSEDRTVRLWDVKTGALLSTSKGHLDQVLSVAFSPNGQYLASSSADKTVRLWDTSSGARIATFKGHSDVVWAAGFSPDGTILASASDDCSIRLWNTTSGSKLTTLRNYDSPEAYCVAFSPDGKRLASGSSRSIHIWKAASGIQLRSLEVSSTVWSVAFSPDGTLLVSGSDDKMIRLWDATSGAPITILGQHSSYVNSVAFSPSGATLASGSTDGTVRLWDISSRSKIATLVRDLDAVYSVAFSHDGSYLAFGVHDGTVQLWKWTNPTVTKSPPMSSRSNLTRHASQNKQHRNSTSTLPQRSSTAPLIRNDMNTVLTLMKNTQIDSDRLGERSLGRSDTHVTNASNTTVSQPLPDVSVLNDISSFVTLLNDDRFGSGGFGDIFLGSHTVLGKVAMKRPHVVLRDASLRRFVREVDLWCSVSHQHILQCLGTCTINRDVYMVSPFVENGDLMSCIRRGMVLDRGKLLYEVAEALCHLHHEGIVHGDIKAQNILLSDQGCALLCDFGLAKALDGTETSTDAKGAGSVRWMAPEMFDGGSRSMASDVYSFGITIAEVLSGRPPFDHLAEAAAVMRYIILQDGRPPKEPMESLEGRSYRTLWKAAEKCWVTKAEGRPHMAKVSKMLFPLT